jgi:hypothetical protein
MKLCLGVFLLFFINTFGVTAVIDAQTEHSGSITSDETWTASGNPHIITELTNVLYREQRLAGAWDNWHQYVSGQ